MNHIYSTLTCDNTYTSYVKGPNDLSIVEKKVLIKGGTGVSNKHFVTPLGVVTGVSDEDLEHLRKNEVFKIHEKNGFITVSKVKKDPEVMVADMETRDEASPIRPEDYAEDDKGAKPMIGKPARK